MRAASDRWFREQGRERQRRHHADHSPGGRGVCELMLQTLQRQLRVSHDVGEIVDAPAAESPHAEPGIEIRPLDHDRYRGHLRAPRPPEVSGQVVEQPGADLDLGPGKPLGQLRGQERAQVKCLESTRQGDRERHGIGDPRSLQDLQGLDQLHCRGSEPV